MSECCFKKERGPHRHQPCGKAATNSLDGQPYCHVHHQILSGRKQREINKSAPIPIPGKDGVTQIYLEEEIEKGERKVLGNKRKATKEASSESDTDSDDGNDNGEGFDWINDRGEIDFLALEQASLAALRKSAFH